MQNYVAHVPKVPILVSLIEIQQLKFNSTGESSVTLAISRSFLV